MAPKVFTTFKVKVKAFAKKIFRVKDKKNKKATGVQEEGAPGVLGATGQQGETVATGDETAAPDETPTATDVEVQKADVPVGTEPTISTEPKTGGNA